MNQNKTQAQKSSAPSLLLFPLGKLVVTRNALARLPEGELAPALVRHQVGDWGLVGKEDWESNNLALRDGARLLSAYDTSNGERFWIITEWDRSVTTILLPEDY